MTLGGQGRLVRVRSSFSVWLAKCFVKQIAVTTKKTEYLNNEIEIFATPGRTCAIDDVL